jgi:nucleoside-diphosphate-sugar epimerase
VTVLGRGRYPALDALGVRTIPGDIRDRAAVRAACARTDVVFHVAAKAGVWGKRREYWETNFEGTRHVIDACRDLGTRRLVFTSTPSVVSGRDHLCGVDESQPYPLAFLCAYAASKAAAERIVLKANGSTLATVALRPHLIWGPGDPHLLPRILDRARKNALVRVGDGTNRVDLTYIDNAAEAHIRAAEALASNPACCGRAYFISDGEPVVLWDWIAAVLRLANLPIVKKRIGFQVAYAVGSTLEMLHCSLPLLGEPRLTRFVATQLAKSHYFDISAARCDLGYAPIVSPAEGLERLRRSWHANSPAREIC